MTSNYSRLVARTHYFLKHSCALTIASKMKLKTIKEVFKYYGKNLTITVDDKSISFALVIIKKPKKTISHKSV